MLPRSLSAKISLIGAASVTLIFGAGLFFISNGTNHTMLSQNGELQANVARTQALQVERDLDLAARTAQEIATTVTALKSQGVTDRAVHDQVLKSSLENNPSLLGTWAGWEPQALDGKDAEFA